MRVRTVLPLVVIALVACTGSASGTASQPTGTPAPSSSTGVDPLVPYSPATTPFAERTRGFVPDTLTLPTRGGGILHVTPVTTTMHTVWVDDTRALAVYLTVENPGDTAWTGKIGANAEVVDEVARTYPAVHPAAGRSASGPDALRRREQGSHRPVRIQPARRPRACWSSTSRRATGRSRSGSVSTAARRGASGRPTSGCSDDGDDLAELDQPEPRCGLRVQARPRVSSPR